MRLWLKVSLLSTITVTAAISVCSLMMLIRSGKSNIALAVSNTLSNLEMRCVSWSTAMENELGYITEPDVKRSLSKYLIEKFADENTILNSGDDCIYNSTAIEPADYLPLDGKGRQYIITDIDGKSIMIAGEMAVFTGTGYSFYVLSDLTSVYDGITSMAYNYALINGVVILIAAACSVLLVRHVVRPVSELRKSTSLIADGVYDKRIDITETDEIGELARDFNRMADAVALTVNELREEAERRTMFMSALTHELKTPMTGIKGNAQTLLATKMSEEEREEALIQIDEECTRIERLSGKLMELIVLRRAAGIALKESSVEELFSIVERSSREQIKNRGLTLRTSCGTDTLKMDVDLLAGLLLNLIDNAGKASKTGDVILLKAEGYTLSVTDHGCGMPAEELSKISQPFYMADRSRSKKLGGIGLGLAIVSETARLHNARLEFESEPGAGTTVRVVFEDEE